MNITRHKLDGVTQNPLPMGKQITPKLIIMHYTAGGSLSSSWNALKNSGLSAHLLVERDGTTEQLVDFDRRADHAGRSEWGELEWLNNHSIGIELCNYGWLPKQGNGVFKRTKAQGATPAFKADEVIVASHKNGWPKDFGWEIYPDEQLKVAMEICQVLVATYPTITDIVGHDEVSPGRKQDPGPAFPITDFRLLVDHQDPPDDDSGPIAVPGGTFFTKHVVTAVSGLNMRSGPGLNTTVKRILSHGQVVNCGPKGAGDWVEVDFDLDGVTDGFVHKSFVRLE